MRGIVRFTVKPDLTPARCPMAVETTEYLAMLRRLIRRAGVRCADADEVELAGLVALHDELDNATLVAVRGLRARGVSWAYIGSAFGMTKQAAHARWGKAA